MNKKTIKFFIKLFVGLTLIAYLLFFKTKPELVVKVLKNSNFILLILSFSLHSVGIFISSVRWKILLDNSQANYSIIDLMKSYLVANFFNHFLPTRFGGDIIRVSDTRNTKSGISGSVSIVAVERTTGIIVLLGFALISSLIKIDFVKKLPFILISMAIGLFGLIIIVIFFKYVKKDFFLRFKFNMNFINKLFLKINSFHNSLLDSIENKIVLKKVFFWSFLLQINVVIHYYLIGLAIGLKIPFVDYFFTIPILLFALTLPITVNGLGVREIVLNAFFIYYGYNMSFAISFSAVDLGFNLILGLIGGIIYLFRKK